MDRYWAFLWSEYLMALIFFPLLNKVTAPYGRHSSSSWGPSMAVRDGWVLMESPALWGSFIFFSTGQHSSKLVPILIFRLFQIHYIHRTLVYPFRMRSEGKEIPVVTVLSAFMFNLYNSYIQAGWISHYGSYNEDWLQSWRFLFGTGIFLLGMTINIWSDSVLISLRRYPSERSYTVPRGYLFRYVSCPNYFGEILEWFGWAILTWSFAGLGFFLITAANLIPRALSNHRWYLKKFPDYPKQRKAVLPFLL